MSIKGSPEWFIEKSKEKQHIKFCEEMESKRIAFIERFSPEKIGTMTPEELLSEVFSKQSSSMIHQLIDKPGNLELFGSAGEMSYLAPVYFSGGTWKKRVGNNGFEISVEDAKDISVAVVKKLLKCVDIISHSSLNSLPDYQALDSKLAKTFEFYKYNWTLKYFQMIFPYYFPCMYSNKKKGTIERASKILFDLDVSSADKIVNMGRISLFIRTCNISNLAFNNIYAEEWSWNGAERPCEAAIANRKIKYEFKGLPDKSFYSLNAFSETNSNMALVIEKEIESLNVEGKEKEAIIKIRINQGVFRELLLKKYDKCALCGVRNSHFLVASHIKPWRDCLPEEKLDFNNGLLLCTHHDKLFDLGFISFDDSGKIMISSELGEVERMFMNVKEKMQIDLTEKNKEYLEYHRKNIFR